MATFTTSRIAACMLLLAPEMLSIALCAGSAGDASCVSENHSKRIDMWACSSRGQLPGSCTGQTISDPPIQYMYPCNALAEGLRARVHTKVSASPECEILESIDPLQDSNFVLVRSIVIISMDHLYHKCMYLDSHQRVADRLSSRPSSLNHTLLLFANCVPAPTQGTHAATGARPAHDDGVPRAPMHTDSAPQSIALRGRQGRHRCARNQLMRKPSRKRKRARAVPRVPYMGPQPSMTRSRRSPSPTSPPLRNSPSGNWNGHHCASTPPDEK